MARQTGSLINRLTSKLPEGLLVDGTWLRMQGYSTQLQHQYVASGWLEQPARGVFRRPRGSVNWQQAVISLQTLLDYPSLVVGGRTSLELQGYAHYLSQTAKDIHLYGPKPLPGWLRKLPLPVALIYHNERRLFGSAADLTAAEATTKLSWGQWDWSLRLSTPERAVLELLDELPQHETFDQADALFGGLSNLRPVRLQKLLADCTNVKVKRLFLFFGARHQHAWFKRLDQDAIELGRGKRMLVKGGTLDPTYQITVPREFDGVR